MALGSFEAGKVHIRVLPDASGFNRKLRPEIQKAKKDAERLLRLQVTPMLDRSALERIKAQLANLGATAHIEAVVDTRRAERALNEATEDRTTTVHVQADPTDLEKSLAEGTKERGVKVKLMGDSSDLERSLADSTRDRGIRIKTKADSREMEKDLRRDLRDRSVRVKTEADARDLEKSLKKNSKAQAVKVPLEADTGKLEKSLKKSTERKPIRIRIQETIDRVDSTRDFLKARSYRRKHGIEGEGIRDVVKRKSIEKFNEKYGDKIDRSKENFKDYFKDASRIKEDMEKAFNWGRKNPFFNRMVIDAQRTVKAVRHVTQEVRLLQEYLSERKARRAPKSGDDDAPSKPKVRDRVVRSVSRVRHIVTEAASTSYHGAVNGATAVGNGVKKSAAAMRDFARSLKEAGSPLAALRVGLAQGAEAAKSFFSRITEGTKSTFKKMKDWVTNSRVEDKDFKESEGAFSHFADRVRKRSEETTTFTQRMSQRLQRFAEKAADKIHWITSGQFDDDDAEDVTNRFFDAFEKGISHHEKPDFKLSDLVDFSDDDLLHKSEERLSDYRDRLQKFEKQNRSLIKRIANSASYDALRGTESFDEMNARLHELARQANLARKNLNAMSAAMRDAKRNKIAKSSQPIENGSTPLTGLRSMREQNALLEQARSRFAALTREAERLGNVDMARGLRESMKRMGDQIEQNIRHQRLFGRTLIDSENRRATRSAAAPSAAPVSAPTSSPVSFDTVPPLGDSVKQLVEKIKELKAERAKLAKELHDAVSSGDVEGVERLNKAFQGVRDNIRNARVELENLSSARDAFDRRGVSAAGIKTPESAPGNKFRESVKTEHGDPVVIEAEVDLDDTRAQEQLSKLTEDKEVTVDANADTGRARMKMASLTRPRNVLISPELNKAAFIKVATALASLSGARAAFDFTKKFTDFVKDMDKNLGQLVKMTAVISTLIAAVLSLTSHVFALGRSLVSMIPALYAIPGLMAAFGVATFATVNALKKWDDHMKDVNDRFKELNNRGADKFWAQFEAPMRRMVDSLFPVWEKGFLDMSDAMGKFFVEGIKGVENFASKGGLDRIFGYMTEGVNSMSRAMAPLTEGLLRFVEIGVSYFPKFGDWFTDMANKFNDWTKSADITSAIDKGVQAMKDLWRVAKETWGILDAISKAAEKAGGATLKDFADALERIHKNLETVQSQWILTTLFEGANKAMGELGKSVDTIWDALSRTADKISEVMVGVSGIINAFVDLMVRAFSNTNFTDEFVQAIKDVKTGMEELSKEGAPLGDILGAISSVVGTMAKVFFPVFGTILHELAPIFQDLGKAAEAVIPVLGTWLKDAIKGIGDVVGPLVHDFSEWVQKNPELAATLGIVGVALGGILGVVGGALGGIGKLVGAVGGIFEGVGAAVAAFGEGGSLAAVGSAFAAAAGPIAIAVVAILALAAAFKYTWDRSEDFRKHIESMAENVRKAFEPTQKFFDEKIKPLLEDAGKRIEDMFKHIGDGVQTFMEGIGDFLDALSPFASAAFDSFNRVFGPPLEALIEHGSKVIEHIGQIIGSVFGAIGEIFKGFASVLRGDFSGALEHGKNAVKNVFDAIANIIGAVFEAIWGILKAFIGFLGGVFGSAIERVKDVFKGVFDGIGKIVGDIIGGVSNTMRDLGPNIGNALSGVPRMIGDMFSKINLFESGKRMLEDWGRGIGSAIEKVKELAFKGVEAVRGLFPHSPAKWGPFARKSNGGDGYVDTAGSKLMRDWADGMRSQDRYLQDTVSSMLGSVRSDMDLDISPQIRAQATSLGFSASTHVDLTGTASAQFTSAMADVFANGVELTLAPQTGRAVLGLNEMGAASLRRSW